MRIEEFNKILSDIENNCLTSLDLGSDQIGDEGAKAIASALEKNQSLTSLDLRDNQIGDEGTKAIADALKTNQSLTILNLGTNQIGDEGVKAIADALKINKSLTSLDLGDNCIEDEGAKAIADALKTNQSLTSLDLKDNRIGAELLAKINDYLARNRFLKEYDQRLRNNDPNLTSLDLKDNQIGVEGAKAIADALKTNQSLTSLDLGYNYIRGELQSEIDDLIKRNSRIRDNLIISIKESIAKNDPTLVITNIEQMPIPHQIYALGKIIEEAGNLDKEGKDITNHLAMIEFLLNQGIKLDESISKIIKEINNPKISNLIQQISFVLQADITESEKITESDTNNQEPILESDLQQPQSQEVVIEEPFLQTEDQPKEIKQPKDQEESKTDNSAAIEIKINNIPESEKPKQQPEPESQLPQQDQEVNQPQQPKPQSQLSQEAIQPEKKEDQEPEIKQTQGETDVTYVDRPQDQIYDTTTQKESPNQEDIRISSQIDTEQKAKNSDQESNIDCNNKTEINSESVDDLPDQLKDTKPNISQQLEETQESVQDITTPTSLQSTTEPIKSTSDSNLDDFQDQRIIKLSNEESGIIIKIKGDGNCLFRAIVARCKYLELSPEIADYFSDHEKLRQKVTEELRRPEYQDLIRQTLSDERQIEISLITEQNIVQYIDNMTKPTFWGGTPEIMVMANLLNGRIVIHENGAQTHNSQILIPQEREYDNWPVLVELVHENVQDEISNDKNHYNLAVNAELASTIITSNSRDDCQAKEETRDDTQNLTNNGEVLKPDQKPAQNSTQTIHQTLTNAKEEIETRVAEIQRELDDKKTTISSELAAKLKTFIEQAKNSTDQITAICDSNADLSDIISKQAAEINELKQSLAEQKNLYEVIKEELSVTKENMTSVEI